MKYLKEPDDYEDEMRYKKYFYKRRESFFESKDIDFSNANVADVFLEGIPLSNKKGK